MLKSDLLWYLVAFICRLELINYRGFQFINPNDLCISKHFAFRPLLMSFNISIPFWLLSSDFFITLAAKTQCSIYGFFTSLKDEDFSLSNQIQAIKQTHKKHMGRKIKDWACHFLIQITPARCTAFSKAIFWLTVCVIYVWTWTEVWLIVFCFVGRDSLSAAERRMWDVILGCWLREVCGFLWKLLGWDQRRGSIGLNGTNGIKDWYVGKRRQIERFGSPFIARASPSAWFIHLSLLVLEAWTLTLLIPSQIRSYWNHMWTFL